MKRLLGSIAALALLLATLSGCIIDPWYDGGYDGGGYRHHRHGYGHGHGGYHDRRY